MAHSGEVIVKVMRAILISKQFSVAQIADLVGVRFDSVETVIQRLLKDGILAKIDKGIGPSVGAKKGRPIQYYFVQDNKINILQNRLDAFSIERSLAEPRKNKPNNQHYLKALSIIESIESGKATITDELCQEASVNLGLSRDYEAVVDDVSDIPAAYIDFAEARLEYLRGEREDAEELLIKAKEVFNKHKLPEESAVDEYLTSAKIKHAIQEAKKSIKNNSYENLGDQLTKLGLSRTPSVSSFIGNLIDDFISVTGQLATLASQQINKNADLEKQIYTLLEENQLLRIQHQIDNEINANLSQAVKNVSAIAATNNLYNRPQAMPESSFIRPQDFVITDTEISQKSRKGHLN